jgi:hypothetical protein
MKQITYSKKVNAYRKLIATRLRNYITDNFIDFDSFADDIGCSSSSINKWVKYGKMPNLNNAKKIEKYLDKKERNRD